MQAAKHDRRAGRRLGRAVLLASATAPLLACQPTKTVIVPGIPATSRVSGQVIDVDATASRVVFLDAGKRLAVSYGPETIVKSGAVDLAPADIRPGDRIVVSVDPGAFDQARVIAVAGGRPPRLPIPASPPNPPNPVSPVSPPGAPHPLTPHTPHVPQTP